MIKLDVIYVSIFRTNFVFQLLLNKLIIPLLNNKIYLFKTYQVNLM